ncbi:hypothetical protein C8J57DRAFT_1532299 [Mycena rebaudengoi]|nr:hypothetical protein C8J57DRAFT_1532299 [Mycena rebaudengoi]
MLEGLSYVAAPQCLSSRDAAPSISPSVSCCGSAWTTPPRAISFRIPVFAGCSRLRGRMHLRLRTLPLAGCVPRRPDTDAVPHLYLCGVTVLEERCVPHARFAAILVLPAPKPVDFPAAHGHGDAAAAFSSRPTALPYPLFSLILSFRARMFSKFVSRILRPPNRRGGRSMLLRLVLVYGSLARVRAPPRGRFAVADWAGAVYHGALPHLVLHALCSPEDVRRARATVQTRLAA